ncbi:MAG: GvpL/GvpF family gas vesicle protein [Alphaproteobacteria bacterium]
MAETANAGERILLHAIADLGALKVIGPRGVECAGTPVRAIKEGRIVSLVSMAPEPIKLPRWLDWLPRPSAPSALPVGAALSSLLPVLPVGPGTVFENEERLRQMLLARESEIASFVTDHSRYVECDLAAGFRVETARADLAASRQVGLLNAETESERQLVRHSLDQAIAGRRGTFLARLRRRVMDHAADIVVHEMDEATGAMRHTMLIPREIRAEFRSSLLALAEDAGAGSWLRLGAYRPPISFRRLEISSASEGEVSAARAKLGIEETADRTAIRVAYERTLERTYANDTQEEQRMRIASLERSFGLLSLVAEGQMKATREPVAKFDAAALKSTWLLQLCTHDLADRAA